MKQELGKAITDKNLKFICDLKVFVTTINFTKELGDPQAEVIFRAEASCLEYSPGKKGVQRDRSLRIDLDKKRFFWEYIAGKYEAINHDEMFEKAMVMIRELNK
jgi:hypothetical protein